jgi:DNA-binding IscR family transcriptional regulator
MWLPREETKAHALAISAFVRERGAVYSAEILERFRISESTLRRRRPVLRRLGLVFVENGRGSFYASAELASQLPTDYLPSRASAATLRDAP